MKYKGIPMEKIANLLFEAKMLKEIPRSGFQFLGAGKESIAEHVFSVSFIAYVISQIEPGIDALKLISMCLIHDLPETRVGDLNTVHKKYVAADEERAMEDAVRGLDFSRNLLDLMAEYNAGLTHEARLAHDADQLALLLELKDLMDIGYQPPKSWVANVIERIQTETGRNIAQAVMKTDRDAWWLQNTTS
jgi:putative hydrolases of HD superfamily